MCIFMVMAIYYNFSEVGKEYEKTFKCYHDGCHKWCIKRSERIVRKRLDKENNDDNLPPSLPNTTPITVNSSSQTSTQYTNMSSQKVTKN
mmetsp:Transcript_47977/g.59006  ORF Transcript_47977/g.59006 Transcript_47977/m.59006 type:complete len:90 (+) Transcript_47977:258-527(+)